MARLAVCWPRTSLKSTKNSCDCFQKRIAIGFQRKDSVAGVYKVNYIQQRAHGVDIDSANHGSFASVGLGKPPAFEILRARASSAMGQRAANATHSAVESQFADEQAVFNGLLREPAISANNAQRHRQIES